MTKKLAEISLIFVLSLIPVLAMAGIYQACNIDPETKACIPGSEQNVYYEGLVPCGKEVVVGVQLDDQGKVILDQDGHPIGGTPVEFPCQFCHIFAMVDNIVKFVLIEIVPLLAVAMFVVAGIMFYSAGGNSNRVEQAKKLFKGIVIGLVIIYGAWLIVTFVLSIIGVASWTGLQGGWYKINCPVQLPPSVSQPLNSNPSNPATPPNPTNPTTNPANPSPPPPTP